MPKFCAAFGRYLTLDSLDLMAWECWDDWDSLFFMLHCLVKLGWVFVGVVFCFRSWNGETSCGWFRARDFLADWLARTCYRMEPASEKDQMQCILGDHFLPGTAISIAAIALCFLAALMKFPEMSCVEPLEADGFQTSLHPSEAGPGSWVRMIRDKDLTEEPQVLLGVFTASEACCTFSANVPRFQDVNLIDCSVIMPCFALFCFMFGIFLCQFLCPLSQWKSK